MSDKFQIHRIRAKEPNYKAVMLWSDTYEMLKQICDENGVKMCSLIDNMAKFCVERIEIVEEDEA